MTKERLIENRDKQSFERVPFDYEDKPVETVSVERRQLFRDGFDAAVIILEDEIQEEAFSRKCRQVNKLLRKNNILRNALKEIFKRPCNKKVGCPCCIANEALIEYLQA